MNKHVNKNNKEKKSNLTVIVIPDNYMQTKEHQAFCLPDWEISKILMIEKTYGYPIFKGNNDYLMIAIISEQEFKDTNNRSNIKHGDKKVITMLRKIFNFDVTI